VREGASESGGVLDVAPDLPRAADLARVRDYHAILADTERAHDRVTVTQALRQRFPRVRILVLDGWRSAADRAQTLDAGADETVDKPVVVPELAARLRAMARRGLEPPASSETLRCGDLVVDLRRHEVSRAGRLLHPTAHEYELIRFLAARPGQVISREEIGARVIEPNFAVSSNAVDVLMCHVRAKLGKPDLIETVRGYGYALRTSP
jgi:two-component system copper resistance phosphate regulon response regulator CusR